jgi:hypothetical protein
MHLIPAASVSTILAVFLCTSLVAQPGGATHCDKGVDVQNRGPSTYRDRGDRCEGVYEQKVAGGTGLRIMSLTDTYPDFKVDAGDSMHLAWKSDGDSQVRLRAISLRQPPYYRMDSTRPSGSSTWTWPASELAVQNMGSREVGLVGVTRRAFKDGDRDVYVPVRVGRNAPPSPDKTLTLIVSPTSTLNALFLTVTPLNPDGSMGVAIVEDHDLKLGPYAARSGIRVPLPPLPNAGYYAVDLAGVAASGGPVSVGLTLYHAR